MKKNRIVILLCCAAIIIAGIAIAAVTTQKKSEKQSIITSTVSYSMAGDADVAEKPFFTLQPGGQFMFMPSFYSGYASAGTYKINGNKLILSTDDGACSIVFKMRDGKFIYSEPDSAFNGDGTDSMDEAQFAKVFKLTDGAVFSEVTQ